MRINFSIYYYINTAFKKVEFTLFIIACLILIVTSKVNHKITDNISSFFVNVSIPIVQVGSYPFNITIDLINNLQELANARSENKILKEENHKLQSLYIKAININQENSNLRDILKFIGLRSVKYKTAKLISSSHQLYNRSIFIDAGSKHGLEIDNIILGTSSVIGRISQIYDKKSLVLLLSDTNSRIPVIISGSRDNGILAGNDSDTMDILYLSKKHNVKVGDMVFTSGDGESLPPGLLTGIVTKVNKNHVTVQAIENINNINIVTIIKY